MTADDAGVNVRERLAGEIKSHRFTTSGLCACGVQLHTTNPIVQAWHLTDAILAAGFWDVAGVEAAAWDEGYESGARDEHFTEFGMSSDSDAAEHPHVNPYRTTDTNGASE